MLKSSLLVFAAVLLAFACSPLQGRSPQQGTPAPALAQEAPAPPPVLAAAPMKNPVKPTAESQAKAKSLYQVDCAVCHGDNGNGKTDLAKSMELTIADWTNPATLANKTAGDRVTISRNGKDKMRSPKKRVAQRTRWISGILLSISGRFRRGSLCPQRLPLRLCSKSRDSGSASTVS